MVLAASIASGGNMAIPSSREIDALLRIMDTARATDQLVLIYVCWWSHVAIIHAPV
jgi:hypothetical protein